MTFKRTLKTLAISAILTVASLPMAAQDMMARYVPVDKKIKQLDTLALQATIERENMESPSSQLYLDWDNHNTHYKASALPETYRINLKGFRMPTPSRVITSQFGPRWGRQHRGLDIKVYIGDTIRAAWSGKVRVVKFEAKGYGNYVVIRHSNGLETYYAHMSKHLVRENQMVRAGQPIGLGGNTGRSTGSHLHFETRLCGVALNPALFFDFRNQDITGDSYLFRRSTMQQEDLKATAARGRKQNGYTKEEVYGGHRPTPTSTVASSTPVKVNEADAIPEPATTPQERKPRSSRELNTHTVQPGETIYTIAKKYNMTVEDFQRMNCLGNSTKVRVGQVMIHS